MKTHRVTPSFLTAEWYAILTHVSVIYLISPLVATWVTRLLYTPLTFLVSIAFSGSAEEQLTYTCSPLTQAATDIPPMGSLLSDLRHKEQRGALIHSLVKESQQITDLFVFLSSETQILHDKPFVQALCIPYICFCFFSIHLLFFLLYFFKGLHLFRSCSCIETEREKIFHPVFTLQIATTTRPGQVQS